MSRERFHTAIHLAIVIAAGADAGLAADRMVGIVPSDGTNMLVKAFAVPAGTTILGAQFENNDPSTTFPEVVLVRGPASALSAGAVVAPVNNVRETALGSVTLTWPAPVSVFEPTTFYLGVCPPAGSVRQGPGVGPGLGAMNVAEPTGSYLASGTERLLIPIRADLAVTLLTTPGLSKTAPPADDPTPAPATGPTVFLTVRANGDEAVINFGVEREADASVSIFDVAGRRVRDLAGGVFAPGKYECVWDGRRQGGSPTSAGVYLVKLTVGSDVVTRKLVMHR